MKEDSKEGSNTPWTILFVLAALIGFVGYIITPIVLGGILYVIIFYAVWPILKRYHNRIELYGVSLAVLVVVVVIYFQTDLILPIQEIPYFFIYSLSEIFQGWGLPTKWAIRFGQQMVYATPFSVLVVLFIWYFFGKKNHSLVRDADLVRDEAKIEKTKAKTKDFLKFRQSDEGFFPGLDWRRGEPVFLSDRDLNMHMQILGSTGFGKTCILLSAVNYHIRKNRSVVIVDGKGGKDLYFQILALAKEHGREDDVVLFSLQYPEMSSTFNPLRRGSPTEIKDKLIGAQIWTEEYYKKVAERVLIIVLNAFADCDVVPTFEKIYQALVNPMSLGLKNFKNEDIEKDFKAYCSNHQKSTRDYSGIAADMIAVTKSNFKHLFEERPDGIDFLEAYNQKKIILFQLPTARYEETAKRLGRIVLHDIKTACSYVEAEYLPHQKRLFPVIIDEFASFAFPSFIDFLNKARSSGAAITILHQSMGDLNVVGEHYAQQICENTNTKIFLRVDDPETTKYISSLMGTRKTIKYTYETHRRLFFRYKTGGASEREVDEFIAHPNEFRVLNMGEGIVYVKTHTKAYRVVFDYINPDISKIEAEFEIKRNKALAAQLPKPKSDPVAEPDTIFQESAFEEIFRKKTEKKADDKTL